MSDDLEKLVQNRDALLLAEVAAWLHDIGKFCDLHVESVSVGGTRQWSNDHAYKVVVDDPSKMICLSKAAANLKKPDALNNVLRAISPKAADSIPVDAKRALEEAEVRVAGENYTLAELIMLGTPGFAVHENRPRLLDGKDGWLPALLGVCHHEAHHDKPELPEGVGQQSYPSVLASTAFGYEIHTFIVGDPQYGLDARLRSLPVTLSALDTPRALMKKIREEFTHGLGDTRRPINEVTLADWSATVAVLFKTALSATVLTSQKPGIRQWLSWRDKEMDHDFRWRTLRVAVDGLAFYSQAARLPDLYARRDLLTQALNLVQTALEETYPIGNEVYRDETGSAFLVPDLQGDDDRGTLIKSLVETEIRSAFDHSDLAGEVVPYVTVSPADACGLTLANELTRPVPAPQADPNRVALWWQCEATDICPVCGLRPQGPPDSKAGRRKVCDTCERRRADRARAWAADKLNTTIWTDEVADVNGRLALLVGQFDLRHWLDGTLVKTLAVVDPAGVQDKTADKVAKNPSFARLRRVWETTRAFWQKVLPTDVDADPAQSLVGQCLDTAGPRLVIQAPNATGLDLASGHTYDLVLGPTKLSVLCRESDLVTVDNLRYAAKQLGAKPEERSTDAQAAAFVQQWLKERGPFVVEEPVGYGSPNKLRGSLTVGDVQPEPTPYTPAIPILAEPRTFMALVPADKALVVVQAIKEKYEREMGKVRNRLPLTLGVIYADRRTPLAAALDAGRRMLRRPAAVKDPATVVAVAHQDVLLDGWPRTVAVTLQIGVRQVVANVPTVMGDGATPDAWYPYWRVEGQPTGRRRQFTGPDGAQWVHVRDLQKDDRVSFTPSTFDFEYLDTSGRRFEVAYGDDGQRRSTNRRQRPYLLEEIDAIEQAWQEISRKSTSQMRMVEALIETKRSAWQESTGTLNVSPVFEQFVGDVLREANIHSEFLERVAVSGLLADALEIHLTIHKEKPQSEEVS